MEDLDAIGIRFGTDKSSKHHNYLNTYERFIGHLRAEKFVFMELGVGPKENIGKSLLTWQEYYPRATIVGVDIRADAKRPFGERIVVEIGDCGSAQFLQQLGKKYAPQVVVDDASHRWSHQVLSFEALFPHIRSGGYYICEDLTTSFSPFLEKGSYSDDDEDAAAYYSRFILSVLGGTRNHRSFAERPQSPLSIQLAREVDWMTVMRGAVIIKKRG